MNGLQQIANRLTGLTMRRSGIALGIWGEPGIGKTHTALSLLRRTPCQSLSVHATQALEMIVRQVPRPKKMSVWLERSLQRLQQGERLETTAFIQTLVALLGANAPLIMHVEDLHEATPDRLEVWQKLALAVTRTRGVGLIATSRAKPPDGFEVIRLEPMNQTASDALLEAEAGAILPAEALAWIFEHARGNPLFTLEFFRFLARQGFVWNDGQRWRWRLPERQVMPVTVEAIIERAINEACTDTATRTALDARAYLESLEPNLKLEPDVWAHVANLEFETLEHAERNLRAQGVLNESGFVHPLFREVPALGLNARDRTAFATRALEVLPLQIAALFIMDAQLGSEPSLALLERAALAATEAGNGIQAARFKADAAQHANGEQRARLALEAANGLRSTDTHEALRLAELAVALVPDDLESLFLLADLHAQEHHKDDVERLIARLPDHQRFRRECLCRIIQFRAVAGNFDAALETWRTHPEVQSDVTTLAVVAQTLYNIGEKDQAEALAAEALARSDLSVTQRIELVNAQAIVQFGRGNMVRAEELFGETVRLARQIADPRRIGVALSNQSAARINLGQYRECEPDIQEALRLFATSGHRRLYAQTQRLLGGLQAEFGNYEQAEELLLESLSMLEQSDTQGFLPDCIRGLCDLYRDWAPPHGRLLALRHAQAGLRFARLQRSPRFLVDALPNAATIEAWNGNAQRALELTQEALPLVAQLAEPVFEMYIQFALGLSFDGLGWPDQALKAFEQAQTIAQKLVAMIEFHKGGLELARLTENLELAKVHLDWFEERGLMNGVNIARRYFPRITASLSSTTKPETSYRIEVLGPMRVLIAGTPEPVRGGKRKELLAVLLEARIMGRSEVSRFDLCDALYPDPDESQASAALSSLVYQLRELFGPSIVLSSDGGYVLGGITSDAETFLETGDTRLWRGEYFESSDRGVGETVRETLHLALRHRAETLLETDPTEAVRVGRLLCSADPYDLESLRLTLRALRAVNNHKSLKSTYARARAGLLEIGEVLPQEWADFLETPTGKSA